MVVGPRFELGSTVVVLVEVVVLKWPYSIENVVVVLVSVEVLVVGHGVEVV